MRAIVRLSTGLLSCLWVLRAFRSDDVKDNNYSTSNLARKNWKNWSMSNGGNRSNNNNNKWALLIGINTYPNLPSLFHLRGCIHDIEVMADILQEKFSFPNGNIVMLREQEATRDRILAAMGDLLNCVSDNDQIVMQYCGHGSQMTDREGDEPDGLDETIVPYDSGRSPYPNRDITDDEIYLWLLQLKKKTPYITLIFDCCHSGTISRDAFGTKSRWLESDTRTINELPPSNLSAKKMEESKLEVGPSGWLPLGKQYVLIAGCRDEESSYEHKILQDGNVIYYGALTYFLSQELVKAGAGATYRDIFERASTYVNMALPRQHPQLEGARDREVFGLHDIEPMRFVSVRKRIKDKVILGAGAAHGMVVGSKWRVYPSGTKQVSDDSSRIGTVKVSEVHAISSHAQILEENGAISDGARAFEDAHFFGEMCLRIEIQAPNGYSDFITRLADTLKLSTMLRLVSAGEAADIRVYLVTPRKKVENGDPVPQLGMITKAIWAAVGQDGKLVMPIHAIEELDVTSTIRENCEKLARYRHTLSLVNPNEDRLLKGKVDFILKRQRNDGTWIVAEPNFSTGYITFQDEERIAFEIRNRHNTPIYVSILDFGLTGAINLLHPVAGASERLEPERSVQIGVREGDEVRLYIPENFPFVTDPEDVEVVGGIETFKLLAITHEADFSVLLQTGLRAINDNNRLGNGSPLIQLLDMALTGWGTRDSRRTRLSTQEEWTTIEHSIFLQQRLQHE